MNKLKSLWNNLPDSVRRVIHTFWQTFAGIFVLGVTDILQELLRTGDFSNARLAVMALVSAAVAAALSAVKGKVVR